MIQPMTDAAAPGRFGLREYSWYSIAFGYPVLGIWYWCTDQTIVQKVLSARTEKDGQAGDSFTATLCMGLLNQRPLSEINDHANRTAAFVCSQRGATPVLPEELMEGRSAGGPTTAT